MEIPEINVYKERLKKEYLDLLSFRKGILAQIESDQREAEIAKRNKEVILATNADLISEANKDLEDFKKQKEYFVNSLEVREADIMSKQKLLGEMSEELKINQAIVSSTKTDYEVLIKKSNDYEKTLEEKSKEADKEVNDIEAIKKENQKVLETNKKEQTRIASCVSTLEGLEKVMKNREAKISLKEEELVKRESEIEAQKQFIKNDRLHLESQQQSLKYAWEETKRKLEEARRLYGNATR